MKEGREGLEGFERGKGVVRRVWKREGSSKKGLEEGREGLERFGRGMGVVRRG